MTEAELHEKARCLLGYGPDLPNADQMAQILASLRVHDAYPSPERLAAEVHYIMRGHNKDNYHPMYPWWR